MGVAKLGSSLRFLEWLLGNCQDFIIPAASSTVVNTENIMDASTNKEHRGKSFSDRVPNSWPKDLPSARRLYPFNVLLERDNPLTVVS